MKIDVRTARALCALMPAHYQQVFNNIYFSDKHNIMYTTDGVSVVMLAAGSELPATLDRDTLQDWTAVSRKTLKQATAGLKVSDWIDMSSIQAESMDDRHIKGFANVYGNLYKVTTPDDNWLVPPSMDEAKVEKLAAVMRAVFSGVSGFFASPDTRTGNKLLSDKDVPSIPCAVAGKNKVYDVKFNGHVIRFSLAGLR